MGYAKDKKKNIDISNHYIGISRKEKSPPFLSGKW